MIKLMATCVLIAASCFCQSAAAAAQTAPGTGKDATTVGQQKPQDATKELGAYFEELRQPYIEQARKSYPGAKARFTAGLPKGYRFYVTLDFQQNKVHENAFMLVRAIVDGRITAVVATKLDKVASPRYGEELTFPESEIIDWTIVSPDGKEEGNLIGTFLDHFYRTR
jgi:hypothetical protein